MRRAERSHTTGARIVEVAILLALPILVHYLVPVRTVVAAPYSYLGAVLMLVGLAVSTWGSMEFRKAGTGLLLRGGGSALVTSGPFRFSRNPMYLGMLIWVLGMAVLLGSLSVFLFPILLFVLAEFYIIPLEEKAMVKTFGDEYLDYKRHVRRWL
jgi:protein-S-isoprenylcysteine O-methyltransferase Ste14